MLIRHYLMIFYIYIKNNLKSSLKFTYSQSNKYDKILFKSIKIINKTKPLGRSLFFNEKTG